MQGGRFGAPFALAAYRAQTIIAGIAVVLVTFVASANAAFAQVLDNQHFLVVRYEV